MRATKGRVRRQQKKKWFRAAKGYRGGRSKLWRTVKETVVRAEAFAYRDRKTRKRDFRTLWIERIGAAARERGMTYSAFIHALQDANIPVNRKMLAEMAVHDPEGFTQLLEKARSAATA
ncbi:MAG: 50S ribosomal protein L20 [Planctomycetota bacterium]|jgi:large subunit ribosomal protein L20|nr:50S ribosomal protein L20 [Planctomycetota bacterium]